MYSKFRKSPFSYNAPWKITNAYGISPNTLRAPTFSNKALHRPNAADQSFDYRAKQNLETLEAVRHPKDRDFYQDHTYHNQWVDRGLEDTQKYALASRYAFMKPGYEIEPWIWYPGDLVEIVQGEGRGLRGTIIAVLKYRNQAIVQNINIQDITIPATDTRPEQKIQREHPIDVTRVRHVDPQTNRLCSVQLVTVRNKETGEVEQKRISMESGTLMPIPPLEEGVQTGDPLKDTAMTDADEPTYDPEKELAILVQRKLHAMEEYFVRQLQRSYEFHSQLSRQNEQDMRRFQRDALTRAVSLTVERVSEGANPMPFTLQPWYQQMLAPYIDVAQQEKLEEEERQAEGAQTNASAPEVRNTVASAPDDDVDDDFKEDDDEGEMDSKSTEEQK